MRNFLIFFVLTFLFGCAQPMQPAQPNKKNEEDLNNKLLHDDWGTFFVVIQTNYIDKGHKLYYVEKVK